MYPRSPEAIAFCPDLFYSQQLPRPLVVPTRALNKMEVVKFFLLIIRKAQPKYNDTPYTMPETC